MNSYFSERENGPRLRISEEITWSVWVGIVRLIWEKLNDNSFAYGYPERCYSDSTEICGCDLDKLKTTMVVEIPDMPWDIVEDPMPPKLTILDLLEFLYKAVAEPTQVPINNVLNRYSYEFDSALGKQKFRERINYIFSRHGIAFELNENGLIVRFIHDVLREPLTKSLFQTGDQDTDQLLNTAREMFMGPKIDNRLESLAKLWDAWERLKTLEHPVKQTGIEILLRKSSPDEPKFLEKLTAEAIALTKIGNEFYGIRHTETDKTPIEFDEQADYLFHRLFALIYLLLVRTNRVNLF